MNEREALSKMVAPGQHRPGKWLGGVVQVWTTNVCNLACYGCTQAGNLRGKARFISPEHFEQAVMSLRAYPGVVGVFGSNPAKHPRFPELCDILAKHIPREQRGLWCNDPMNEENGAAMRRTFNPAVSNLNVHLSREAHDRFRRWWPEAKPFGLDQDSRHSPVHGAMKDILRTMCPTCGDCEHDRRWLNSEGEIETCPTCKGTGHVYDEGKAWELISRCDINQHWSAMIGEFRGELRAWFCEVAGAQSIMRQDEEDYPDTGISPAIRYSLGGYDTGDELEWWQLKMPLFAHQVRKHCHECLVPLRGYGELAQDEGGTEQTTATYADVFKPKVRGRSLEVITSVEQLLPGRIQKTIDYVGNAKR